jgi:hypothetical protein
MSRKILVSNRAALIGKYGPSGLRRIREGVRELTKADKSRGFETRLIFLDDAALLKSFAVTDPESGQQHKRAIDRIYDLFNPEYLVILDAPDVVPHVSLINPAAGDGDPDVPSDLPYACDAAFSGRDPKIFTTVTRVVGRIPGIAGAARPTFLLKVLAASARFQPRSRSEYMDYFAITAAAWRKSTHRSVKAVFGSERVRVSPPTINNDANRYLSAQMHFINCHGDTLAPEFYGQRKKYYPVAMNTEGVARNASPRTVVAAECCYGAQLYKPSEQKDERPPISISYFDRGAIGFFGSTNTAYGDAARNSAADLITQYFLINVLNGSSLGRACLEARQMFVDKEDLDIYNLKTLAQFLLLGDPSLHPCREHEDEQHPEFADRSAARAKRRMDLVALGKSAGESSNFPGRQQAKPPKRMARRLQRIAGQFGIRGGEISAYDLTGGPLYRAAIKNQDVKPRMFVVSKVSRVKKGAANGGRARQVSALVVHSYRGGVARVVHYVSR